MLALTGVPGTGKTTIAEAMPDDVHVLSARQIAYEVDALEGEDHQRGAEIVDERVLEERAREAIPDEGRVLVEGVIAHHCSPDGVILLRCHPTELGSRLAKRDWPEAKVEENVMAETLDALVAEITISPAREIDTTQEDPDVLAERIVGLFTGEGFNRPWNDPLGTADWSDTLLGDD